MTTHGQGDWTLYRQSLGLAPSDEVDLHFGRRDPDANYCDVMAEVERIVKNALVRAQQADRPYVMFVHGHSTSRPGQTTARSVVRRFMRSPEATPLVLKSDSNITQYILRRFARALTRRNAGPIATPPPQSTTDH
jgi:hypothetical protein